MPLQSTSALNVLVVLAFAIPTLAWGEPVTEPSLKGYGIKGVNGATLAEMRDRCDRAARGDATPAENEDPALLEARCDQLARTLRNQPGNAGHAKR